MWGGDLKCMVCGSRHAPTSARQNIARGSGHILRCTASSCCLVREAQSSAQASALLSAASDALGSSNRPANVGHHANLSAYLGAKMEQSRYLASSFRKGKRNVMLPAFSWKNSMVGLWRRVALPQPMGWRYHA